MLMKKRMLRFLSLLLCGLGSSTAVAQVLVEKEAGVAYTYEQVITAYQELDQRYTNALYLEAGQTDCGRPLSLFLIQAEAFSEEQSLNQLAEGKLVSLINNGIHPGESCGMDASLVWAQELLEAGGPSPGQLIAIIPVYNIGGSLQGRPNTRANQNGPQIQGFRGNASNLDLNRDFIKGDALNTLSFWAIYQALSPHIFVDTHTSNGADYPYTLTLIASQKDKLAPSLARFQQEEMLPYLYQGMEETWPMIPYVNVFGRVPNDGYAAFLETPRYASGYTALFHSLGFITEAHMFKPYPDRVAATLEFLRVLQDFSEEHAAAIKTAYADAQQWEAQTEHFPINWELDSSDVRSLSFRAYDYAYEPSKLGDYQRLKYDRSSETTLEIDYYPTYKAIAKAGRPKYYVIPGAWRDVIQRLQYHNIEMLPLSEDTVMEVYSAYLKDWSFAESPYEGHFRINVNSIRPQKQKRRFLAGDYLIPSDQDHAYFLATVLEPLSVDSYLSWGFFNSIFQQKEYFSPYIFEDRAEAMLEADPKLAQEFEAWKTANPQLLQNPWAVLSFFYQRSEYYEPEHLRYPVAVIR